VPAKLFFAVGLILSFALGAGWAAKTPAAAASVAIAGAEESPQFSPRQDPAQKEMQERMYKEANKKRQQDIRQDTDKLFELATELKASVDKTNENMLSLDVVRKAEQVEKLAKKVKENMKEAIGPTPKDEQEERKLPRPFPH
jgi:hypothetical protein